MTSEAPTPKSPDDPEAVIRREQQDNLDLLRALRQVSEQARADRHRQTAIVVSVVTALFVIRQVLPPAWTVWLPL